MRLDHVHLHVRDREAAVRWLGEVFGLVPAPGFAAWAEVPGGPLFLATADGESALALFEGEPDAAGDHTIAFRMHTDAFLAFGGRAEMLGLRDRHGRTLSVNGPIDHDGLAFSYYFVDPNGHRFEATCYEVDDVRVRLKG